MGFVEEFLFIYTTYVTTYFYVNKTCTLFLIPIFNSRVFEIVKTLLNHFHYLHYLFIQSFLQDRQFSSVTSFAPHAVRIPRGYAWHTLAWHTRSNTPTLVSSGRRKRESAGERPDCDDVTDVRRIVLMKMKSARILSTFSEHSLASCTEASDSVEAATLFRAACH